VSRWLFAALAFVGFAVHAESINVVDELRTLPAPSERMKQIDGAARAAFDAALAEYDQQVEQNPYDVVDRLQRCRFIDQFVASYEYAGFVDEISDLAAKCRATLVEEHPEHPEIALWQLEQTFGDELLDKGNALLGKPDSATWTAGQSARLYTALARAADLSDKRDLALRYSLRALDLDETADVRLIAATHLIATGDKARALEILTATFRQDSSPEGWVLTKKMELLAQLGAYQQTIELHSQLKELSDYDHTLVAKVLRTAGANDLARQELTRASEGEGPYGTANERELFHFELELGSAEQALTAYHAWRNSGWFEDPLGINRFALFIRDPLLPWQARDLIGLLGFLCALAAVAIIAIVPVAGVHYRGLVVRAHTAEPYPSGSGWRLQHAWAALFCFGIASIFALYSAGAVDVTTSNAGGWGIDGTDPQLARIALVESLLTIALLLPLAVLAKTRQAPWLGTEWTIGRSCLVGVGLALVFRLPLLTAWAANPGAMNQLAVDDELWQMIGAVRDQYGTITALWIVGITAPVVEEFVFRGILYRAFSAHIRPLWANVVQAALFSAMHMNLKAAVVLFLFGLVLGTITRRSGGLLGPMVMHAAFNLIAALILLN